MSTPESTPTHVPWPWAALCHSRLYRTENFDFEHKDERRHLGYASSSSWKMFINYNHGVSVSQSNRQIAEWRQIR